MSTWVANKFIKRCIRVDPVSRKSGSLLDMTAQDFNPKYEQEAIKFAKQKT